MININKIIIVGRLSRDPELKYAAGKDMAICKFSVAVSRMKKTDPADFLNCVAFGKVGETIAQYLTKGKQIALEGRLQTGSYNNKDGVKVYTSDIMVEKFDFIGDKSGGNNSSNDEIIPIDDGMMPF